jgi:hypothetical protein
LKAFSATRMKARAFGSGVSWCGARFVARKHDPGRQRGLGRARAMLSAGAFMCATVPLAVSRTGWAEHGVRGEVRGSPRSMRSSG